MVVQLLSYASVLMKNVDNKDGPSTVQTDSTIQPISPTKPESNIYNQRKKEGIANQRRGFAAEKCLVRLLNYTSFRRAFSDFFGLSTKYSAKSARLTPMSTKTDVDFSNPITDRVNFQVKSSTICENPKPFLQEGRGGQIDKRSCASFVKLFHLEKFNNILRPFFEIPLDQRTGKVDYRIGSKLLTSENYSNSVLDNLVHEFNQRKDMILNTLFLGNSELTKPEFITFILYEKNTNKEKYLVIYRMYDIIKYLKKFQFTIGKNGTYLTLGNIFSIRRKGGDSGRSTANKVQAILNVKMLLDNMDSPDSNKTGFYYKF